jgi:hypothetical protein
MKRSPIPDLPTLRAHYEAMAEALEQARFEELASMTEEQAQRRMRSLELFDPASVPARESSGLVEQQRLFARLRAK